MTNPEQLSAGVHTAGRWTDGNEAIHTQTQRSRPWSGTVFRRHHDGTEADALVAMTFGATPEDAADLARKIAAVPDLLEALEVVTEDAQALLDFACRQCEFEGDPKLFEADIGRARAALTKARSNHEG